MSKITPASARSEKRHAHAGGKVKETKKYANGGAKRARLSPSSDDQEKRLKTKKTVSLSKKEEKELLVEEIAALKAKLQVLQYRTLFPEYPRMQNQTQQELTNSMLRHAIHSQQFAIADGHALISGYVSRQLVSPIKTVIRLGKDRENRWNTLAALKPIKLQEAHQYIMVRSRHLDPIRFHLEEDQFETEAGDFVVIRLDRVPIYGATSVKAVHDGLIFQIMNMEISISDMMGNLTVREDDDCGDHSISHHRMASTTPDGVRTESSTVVFSDYDATKYGGLGSAMLVADYVDEDELHPYRPDERVRRDTTAIFLLTPHTHVVTTNTGEKQEEFMVILTRFGQGQLHHARFDIPRPVLHRMRRTFIKWIDEFTKAVQDSFAMETTAPANHSSIP